MNVDTTMNGMYVHHQRLEHLAETLATAGHKMAAEELRREVYKLGCQISQVEGVLGDYKIDIAAAQHQGQPRWVGVDRAAGQLAGRCFNGSDS